MANIKSQIKRIKTNEKARLRNKDVRSALKTAVRQAREAQAGGDVEAATAAVRNATRKLDKAASKGVIHKNQAANRKSALTAALTKVGLEPVVTATPTKKATTASKASKSAKSSKKAPARGR